MSTTILKFEATAFCPQDDDAPDCLAASISIPVEEDDEVIGNTINNEDLIVHAVGALHDLATYMRPEWLDDEDISMTLDIYLGGAKCQSRGGIIAMKPESYTFDIED